MDKLYKVYKIFNTKKIHIMLLQSMLTTKIWIKLIIVEDRLVQELCLIGFKIVPMNNSFVGSIILMNILSKIIYTLQKNPNIHCSLKYGSLSYKKWIHRKTHKLTTKFNMTYNKSTSHFYSFYNSNIKMSMISNPTNEQPTSNMTPWYWYRSNPYTFPIETSMMQINTNIVPTQLMWCLMQYPSMKQGVA